MRLADEEEEEEEEESSDCERGGVREKRKRGKAEDINYNG